MSTISAGTASTSAIVVSGDTTGNLLFNTNSTENARIDSSGRMGIGVVPSGNGLLELKAGTTAVAPLKLNSGTNLTSASAGVVEYDGRVFYATPQGTQRGLIPGAQFYRLDTAFVGANVATAQPVFNVGVTLSGSTVYQFEAVYALSRASGTTAHTIGLGFGGTATLNNISYLMQYYGSSASFTGTTGTSAQTFYIQTAANTSASIAGINTPAYVTFTLRGSVSINAGGTFIPQYTLSVAPGAYTTAISSYFLIYPIGTSGANTSVGTWA